MDHFGYVLGVAITDASVFVTDSGQTHKRADGTIARYKSAQYRISLQCKDREFADRLAYHLAALIDRPVSVTPIRRTMGRSTLRGLADGYEFHGFQVRVSAKDLCLRLLELLDAMKAGSFEPILSLHDDVLRATLNGIVDGDGYVTRGGQIVIRQKGPTFIVALCERLGIGVRVYSYPAQTADQITIARPAAAGIDTYKRAKT